MKCELCNILLKIQNAIIRKAFRVLIRIAFCGFKNTVAQMANNINLQIEIMLCKKNFFLFFFISFFFYKMLASCIFLCDWKL